MDHEMKSINWTLMLSWLSIIGILTVAYMLEVLKGDRTVQYLFVFWMIMLIPWIFNYVLLIKKEDRSDLGYYVVAGYSIMYAFVMATGSTPLVANYILPLLCFLILYHRPPLILFSFAIAFVINVVVFVAMFFQGIITMDNLRDVEICLASIIICFTGAYFSTKLYDQVHNERLDKAVEALKAEAANDAKGEFLAHMSHEIRTPINAVLGMDTMILRESNEPVIKEYAFDIQKAGKTLLAIVNDILDISKIESGKMEIVPVDYDVSSLVNDTVNLIQDKVNTKGLKFNIDIDNTIPCFLHGDDIRIRQVLINLLSNAVKYTEKGEVTFSVKGTKSDGVCRLHFSVKDTGIGIKSEDIDKLFAEFERIEELRNRNIEGTGLGMAITTKLLDMMGSTLKVESEYGVGSEFYFDIEQPIVNEEPIGNIAERISQMVDEYIYEVSFIAPDAKILVVDDNPVNLSVFCNLVKETQVNVDTAQSGKSALELIGETKYDIIFLDHMMPDMDGIEVMHNIESDSEHPNQDTPVIVLTANAIVGAKEEYIKAGFDDYLAKPIIPEKLEKLIENYLADDKKLKPALGEAKKRVEEPKHISNDNQLPQVEGINWDYALMHLGDVNTVLVTAKSVYDAMESDVLELSEYYNTIINDSSNEAAIDSYRIKVHSMKTNMTMLGIVPLAGLATTLEYAARDREISKIIEMTSHFVNDCRKYKLKLADVCGIDSNIDKKPIEDVNEVIGYINQLMEKMSMFDVHGADYALEQIKAYQYNDDVEKLLDMMSGAVSNLDVDKVTELGNELIQRIS